MNDEKQIPVSDNDAVNFDGGTEEATAVTEVQTEEEPETQETSEVEAAAPDPEEHTKELETKLHALKDRLLRTAAELDNVRKRSRREIDEALVTGRSEVLREILPVMDSIDLALSSADPEGSASAIVEGVEMVRKQFFSATERFRLKVVESVGKAFDPNFHEAVAQVPSPENEVGQIIEELRKGYVLGERLLRAAMVVVSSGAPQQTEESETGAENGINETSESPPFESDMVADNSQSAGEETRIEDDDEQ